jgi:hypothetical protein
MIIGEGEAAVLIQPFHVVREIRVPLQSY